MKHELPVTLQIAQNVPTTVLTKIHFFQINSMTIFSVWFTKKI